MGRLIDGDSFEAGIKILFGESNPIIRIVINKLHDQPTVEAIPKDQYEARLKTDMTVMLTELKNELIDISWNIDMYDSDLDFECCYLSDINKVIQQKINKLK